MYHVGIGIVTYNPNIEQLKKGLNLLVKERISVYIVDNNSSNINDIELVINDKNIILKKNKSNLGIAAALNQVLRFAKIDKIDWMITLDQDSILSEDYIEIVYKYLKGKNVAIYCPVIYDRNRDIIDKTSVTKKGNTLYSIVEVDKCITSGAIYNVNIWESLGGFNEKLFIDGVDFEYCFRAKKSGYKIYQISELKLNHSIGNGKVFKFGIMHVGVHNHSPFRKYYIARNRIYCDYLNRNRIRIKSYLSILKMFLIVIIFEDEKLEKSKSLLRGIKDGIGMVKNEKR